MIDAIHSVILAMSDILYQPCFVPLLRLAAGAFFTVRTTRVQLCLFKEGCHVIPDRPEHGGNISSFGALMAFTASRAGTGNIIGVSMVICTGGRPDYNAAHSPEDP